ncbi:MAG: arginine--tRNA ligase [Nitrospirota bacterium]
MKNKILRIINNALLKAKEKGELSLPELPPVVLEIPKEEGHGDFATTVALSLAKSEKKPPRQIADKIKAAIEDSEGILEKIEIAGPGYINLFIKDSAWLSVLGEIEHKGADYGRSNIGNGKPVQVEFVSANPTGPLHIGHGRGAAVGDSLARLLSFAGYDVKREFYINDFGSQVENLGNSIYFQYLELSGNAEAVKVIDAAKPSDEETPGAEGTLNLYLGEYITELAQEFMARPEFEKLSEDEKKNYCREVGITEMLRQIKVTLAKFGMSFDEWYSERRLYDKANNLVEAAIAELREKGLVFEDGGATWLRTTKFGDDKDRVLIRSNGQTTYFASDIAYHRDKFMRGFREIIDVWGADHHGYIPRMKAAIQALEHDRDEFQVLLVQLVNLMREGQPVKMSKRAGTFVTLEEVMDEVGTDACRFTFMLRRPDSHLDFDLDLVKSQSSENPVYYVQYAHARLSSVFRQAAEKGIALPPIEKVDLSRLTLPEELSIIKRLAAFPELLEKAAEAKEPHRLTYYLQELATLLHSYYFRHKFISDDLELSYARMHLVKAVRQVIATALNLLGVSAPESM